MITLSEGRVIERGPSAVDPRHLQVESQFIRVSIAWHPGYQVSSLEVIVCSCNIAEQRSVRSDITQ